jgi:hypothetical protein
VKNIIYWMFFEILLGIWLFFSPWVLGFQGSGLAALNSRILGGLLMALGAGITIYAIYVEDRPERRESEEVRGS